MARAHAHIPTHVLTHARHTAQVGAPAPPLATHGKDGRRQLPPPSTGRGRSAAPGLTRANHRGQYHNPTLPTRLPHISAGGQEFEKWEAGEVGGEKGSGANTAAVDQDPGEPTDIDGGFIRLEICL